jgi:hypothetical protein
VFLRIKLNNAWYNLIRESIRNMAAAVIINLRVKFSRDEIAVMRSISSLKRSNCPKLTSLFQSKSSNQAYPECTFESLRYAPKGNKLNNLKNKRVKLGL